MKASDFRTIHAQASIFTPELEIRGNRLLAHLVGSHAEKLDGEPVILPTIDSAPEGFLTRDLPRFTFKNKDGSLKLVVAAARVDAVSESWKIDDTALADFKKWALDTFKGYRSFTQTRIGRLAFIIKRVAENPQPARELTTHFCKENWLKGPLNRPESFELHAHKKFALTAQDTVNSWFRCKVATLNAREQTPETPAVLVEQDLNTLAEEIGTASYGDEDLKRFFDAAIGESLNILRLYFPT